MKVRTKTVCRALFTLLIVASLSVSGLHATKQALRIRTDLVSVAVSVVTRDGSPVVGLQREHFEVYEDNVRQEIEYFSDADQPATVGIIFDHSGSMRHRLAQAREALKSFLDTGHPEDEYVLFSFSEQVSQPLQASKGEDLLRRLHGLSPQGDTALYDAIYLALERLRESRHRRRALLLVTDGVDNHSRYGISDVRRQLREAAVTIYAIGNREPTSSDCGRVCHFEATARLESLAAMSGGKAFFPISRQDVEKNVSQIAVELRRQYSLGYLPSAAQRESGWRKVKVRVKSEGLGVNVSVRAREEYYAPFE